MKLARQVRKVSGSLSKVEQEAKDTKADFEWQARRAEQQRLEEEERLATLTNERGRMLLKLKRLVEEKERRCEEEEGRTKGGWPQLEASRLAAYYEKKSSQSTLENEVSELRMQLRKREEKFGQQSARLHRAEMGLLDAEAEAARYRKFYEQATSNSPLP